MIALNKRMRTLTLVTVLSAGVGSTGVALGQGEVGGGGTMNVEPSTVEAGDSYVVSNDPASRCTLGEVSGDTGGVRPGAWFTEPDGNGDWSVTIQVPESGPPDPMGNPTPFPEGEYDQNAFCQQPDPAASAAAAAQQEGFAYDSVTVTVVAPAQEEPTPPPAPPAAEPAAEEPSFAG